VVLGVVAGTAVLTGALLVGDSLRGSLRASVLSRLDNLDCVVQSSGFFRADLAREIAARPGFPRDRGAVDALIIVRGSASHANSGAHVRNVSILSFAAPSLEAEARARATPAAGHAVALNRNLADELGARPGDEILLRVAKPAAISPETLLGHRDDALVTLRLSVVAILDRDEFNITLNPSEIRPLNAFVPERTLQRGLGQPDRTNTLFVTGGPRGGGDAAAVSRLAGILGECATLADFGLTLRPDDGHGYVALECDAFLLAPPVEEAARGAAKALGVPAMGVLAYLANSIAVETRPEAEVPYSIVAAIEPGPELLGSLTATDGNPAPAFASGKILLNEWTARELHARVGEPIRLRYWVAGPLGQLTSEESTFHLRAILRMCGAALDPGFAPPYRGITDATTLTDWNPPFPIDMHKIRPQDEAYWQTYRTAPKALISLADGERMWAHDGERFGRLTSLRFYPRAGQAPANLQLEIEQELRRRLDPARLGFRIDALRARALVASRGTTDFSGLFLAFSLFLIAAAAMLVTLLYRLGVERRAREIGLLLATGFPRRRVARLLLGEGLVVATIGAAVGLLAARGYAGLMLAGLQDWWATALSTPALELHTRPASYVVGGIASVVLAVAAIAVALRGVARTPARALLAGAVPSRAPAERRGVTRRGERAAGWIFMGLAAGALALARLIGWPSAPGAFFFAGASLLVACGAALAHWLKSGPRTALPRAGRQALVRLGIRNARRHAGRSLLTAGLIATATFVLAALQALRLNVSGDAYARHSGTGGFTLLAEMDVPLLHDLNTPAGRAALNLSQTAQEALRDAVFFPCRLRPGDEASCRNLYIPTQPRVLGVADALLDRGGFSFTAMLAADDPARRNPWRLLRETLADGAIPTIADETTALWQLHVQLGDTLHLTDERGRDVRLRLVALLDNSVLQGALLIAEPQFTRLFPSIAGSAFLLVETPPARAAEVRRVLERELADFGLAATSTRARLGDLLAVQNVYLTTFQILGGLGLVLGTVGLAAVLLRNIAERRSELALLRTLGFSRAAVGTLVLAENTFLVVVGLVAGLGCAAVVVTPQVMSRAMTIPWASLALMVATVLVTGLVAGVGTVVPALRAPLLPALRSE
jgi:ABC-type lipoprotein release transport system permease subunit